MSEIFSLKRFGGLLRVQCLSHLIPFLIAFGIFLVSFAGLNYLVSLNESYIEQAVGFSVVLIIQFFFIPFITGLLASHSFREYHERSKACQLMMLPASRVEKFSSLYMIYVVLVPVCFVLSAVLVETGFLVNFAHLVIEKYQGTEELAVVQSSLNGPISFEDIVNGSLIGAKTVVLFCFLLAGVQALFFLGSSLFKNLPYIKTVLICLGLSILFICLFNTVEGLSEFGDNFVSDYSGTKDSYLIGPAIFLFIMTALSWLRFRSMKLS